MLTFIEWNNNQTHPTATPISPIQPRAINYEDKYHDQFYFHLFDFKRGPGHIASWQLWTCNFSPRQDWSRPSPIFSHCLFLVWVPGPQLELHIVHWDQADQAENEMWGKVFLFSSSHTWTRSFQALLHFNHICFRAGRAAVSGSCTSATTGPGNIDVNCGYKPCERLVEDKRRMWWYLYTPCSKGKR